MKLFSLHKHKIKFAYANKIKDYCYEINGYYILNKNEEKTIPKESFLYLSCNNSDCNNIYPEQKEKKTFKIKDTINMKGLINEFYSDGDFKKAYKNNTRIYSYDLSPKEFYLLNKEYEDNIVLIGTEDEKKAFFDNNELKKYKEYYEKLKDELIQFKEDDKKLKVELKKYKEYYKKLKEEKDSLLRRINEINKEKDNLSYSNYNLKYENKKLNSDNSSLRKEMDSKITFQRDHNNDKETYDIVISISSIIGLSKEGWIIKYPKKKEEYLRKSKKKTIIIGVVGNGNKGKSFVLGKLSDYDVPQGFTIRTEGLSIRYGEKDDHCIAILDSAGQETPLLNIDNKLQETPLLNMDNKVKVFNIPKERNNTEKDENNAFEKCLRDKLITETFIQQFIINTSHILVLVVGLITLNEQKILERVKQSLSSDKYLFVIHNLQNFVTKEQVEGYIEGTLKKLFGIKIEENNFQNISPTQHQKYYVETDNNKITHLIFVNDYSPIAYYYNEPTVTFLKKKLHVEQNRTEFSVVKKVKEYFLKIHHDFLDGKFEEKDFSSENEDKILLKTVKDIKLKKVFLDEIGKTIANYADQPNYFYYSEGNQFIIGIELPGEGADIKAKLNRSDEFYIFGFKGTKPGSINKTKNNEKPIINKNLKKDINFDFEIRIPLKDIDILPNNKGKMNYNERTNKNGVFIYKYNINDGNNDNDYE